MFKFLNKYKLKKNINNYQ